MNKLNNLLDEILTDIGCDCNIKPQLIEAFDSETHEYYELLNRKERIFVSIAILSVIPSLTWLFMLGSTSTEPVLQKWEPVKNNWSLEFRDADIKDICPI